MKIQANYNAPRGFFARLFTKTVRRKDIPLGTIFAHSRTSRNHYLAIGGTKVLGEHKAYLCINLNYPEDGVVFTHADEKCIILGNIQVEQ